MTFDILEVIASFERTTDQFLSKEEFRRRLRSRRQQRIKYTIDIKTDSLHLGHAVNLWMIRRLQDLGHKAVVVFTDFTSRIGDKDGRLETIASYPKKVMERKIHDLTQQLRMILRDDVRLLEIRRNSEWYEIMRIQEMMDVLSLVTHAKIISRDSFQLRLAEKKELYLNEMLYPVLQGYDSYRAMADISIVGSDQLFNESIGRLIQEKHKKKPQTLITTRMTPGLDGKTKQSQSRDNHIALSHPPRSKFGRAMSIPDELIRDYFLIYTDLPLADLSALDGVIDHNPREAKVMLATKIVERYHGSAIAAEEREWFENTISRGHAPDDIPALRVMTSRMEALDLVVLARPEKSHGDSRRLIQQGGVDLNGKKLSKPDQLLTLKSGDILQIGKRQWFRIELVRLSSLDSGKLLMRACQLQDIEQIMARIPTPELARYLLSLPPDKKASASAASGALKKIILQPLKAEAVLFAIFSKTEPEKMIGIAQLQWRGMKEEINYWMDAAALNDRSVTTAVQALGQHVFKEMQLGSVIFKNAFTSAHTPEMLYEAQRTMDQALLSREDPAGMPGFTPEGWDRLQQWRRMTAPWLFANDTTQSRHNITFRKSTPSPSSLGPAQPGDPRKPK